MAWTAPRTWVAGETVTAALMNTHVRDNLKALGDPWLAWTPTVTAETGAFTTATGAGQYAAAGKSILWSATLTITTVGTGANGVRFTLPVTARAANSYLGGGRESAATGVQLEVHANTTTQATVYKYDASSIIAAGRILNLGGLYEAA